MHPTRTICDLNQIVNDEIYRAHKDKARNRYDKRKKGVIDHSKNCVCVCRQNVYTLVSRAQTLTEPRLDNIYFYGFHIVQILYINSEFIYRFIHSCKHRTRQKYAEVFRKYQSLILII